MAKNYKMLETVREFRTAKFPNNTFLILKCDDKYIWANKYCGEVTTYSSKKYDNVEDLVSVLSDRYDGVLENLTQNIGHLVKIYI